MGKSLRLLIAIIVILSFVLIARNGSAWAANTASSQSADPSLSTEKHKHCDPPHDKHAREKCHEDDDDDGTVQPPPDVVEICEKGSYSIGGVVVLDVKNLGFGKRACLTASTRPPDPNVDKIPQWAGKILSAVLNLTLSAHNTKVQVCFAAPPGKKLLNIYSSTGGEWKPVKTRVKNGVACTDASGSGRFALVGK